MTTTELAAKLKELVAAGSDKEIESMLDESLKLDMGKVESFLEETAEGKRILQSISDKAVSSYEKDKLPLKQEEYFKKKQIELNPPEDPEKKALLERVVALEKNLNEKAKSERIMAHKSLFSKLFSEKKLPPKAIELIEHLGLDFDSDAAGEKAATVAAILEEVVNAGADARIRGNAHVPGQSLQPAPSGPELSDAEYFEKRMKQRQQEKSHG